VIAISSTILSNQVGPTGEVRQVVLTAAAGGRRLVEAQGVVGITTDATAVAVEASLIVAAAEAIERVGRLGVVRDEALALELLADDRADVGKERPAEQFDRQWLTVLGPDAVTTLLPALLGQQFGALARIELVGVMAS
jgi:hypothetical protein